MANFEITLLGLTFLGVALGGWSLCWARFSQIDGRALWGQRLCMVTLVYLGICALVAASTHADALAPLGLSAGLLLVAMLWESPVSRPKEV